VSSCAPLTPTPRTFPPEDRTIFGDRTGLLKLFGEQRGRCELASVQEHPDPLADG
jgi:hypothetical protein